MTKLITVAQAADVLSVKEWRVYEYVNQGILPPGVVVWVGRLLRFDPDALSEWIKSGGQRHAKDWAKRA